MGLRDYHTSSKQYTSRQRRWQDEIPQRFVRPFEIQYENFRGDHATFTGDLTSVRVRHAHLSAAVQPTGRRITLKMEKIENLQDIQRALSHSPRPTGREARVLGYHKKRGTTSPLYESLRRKYPDF